jgi:hypothetical protein
MQSLQDRPIPLRVANYENCLQVEWLSVTLRSRTCHRSLCDLLLPSGCGLILRETKIPVQPVIHKIFGVNFVCDFKSTLTENLLKQPLATALLISCREVTGCPVFVVAAALIVAHTKRAKVKGFFTFVSL